MKKISYAIEAAALWLAFTIFRCMPLDNASGLGGWIGRTIGPRLGASRKARVNIERAMPKKSASEVDTIIRDMWDNLGRVIAEYPHLLKIITERCDVSGEENLDAIGEDARCLIIGGHLANWELYSFFFNHKKKWPVVSIYRAPNNPYAEKLLEQCRTLDTEGLFIPKSSRGARSMVKSLQDGGRLGILIDQKYNQGVAAPFFGRPAMTSPAFATLAAKFDCPILPMRVERLEGCHFRVSFSPPLQTSPKDEMAVIAEAHALLEDWIRAKPAQWLWLHRRWDSKALKDFQ